MMNKVTDSGLRLNTAPGLRFRSDNISRPQEPQEQKSRRLDDDIKLTGLNPRAMDLFEAERQAIEAKQVELETNPLHKKAAGILPGIPNQGLRIKNTRAALTRLDRAVGPHMTPVVLSLLALEKTIHEHNGRQWDSMLSFKFLAFLGQSAKNWYSLRSNLVKDFATLGVREKSLQTALAKVPGIDRESRFLVSTLAGDEEESGLDLLVEQSSQWQYVDAGKLKSPFREMAQKYMLNPGSQHTPTS